MILTPTENMTKFMEENKISPVISGTRLTSTGSEVLTKADLDDSNQIKYTLANGKSFIITCHDVISAPTYSPKWDI